MSLNLYGPINELGYGIATRGLIKGLKSLQISNFHLNPIGPIQIENQQEAADLQNNIKVFWNRKLPSIAVWHEFDLSKFSGNKLVAMPIFETSDFFPIAKSYLSQIDAVLVLSTWAKNVIHESINKNIQVFVVPSSANLIETPDVLNTKKAPVFTFLSIGKLEKRKGHFDLIQAYINAFRSYPAETRLILHCFSPFEQNFTNTIQSVFKNLGLTIINSINKGSCLVGTAGRAIVEVPLGRIPEDQINKLYRYAHIGVFPARAEGWNLPLMEALQSGLPCIATNYSAHTEYLNDKFNYPNELLLNNLEMEIAQDGKYFHGDRGYWCKFNLNDLSEKMINTYKNYDSIIQKFDNSLLRQAFTWENSARKLMEALAQI